MILHMRFLCDVLYFGAAVFVLGKVLYQQHLCKCDGGGEADDDHHGGVDAEVLPPPPALLGSGLVFLLLLAALLLVLLGVFQGPLALATELLLLMSFQTHVEPNMLPKKIETQDQIL